MIYYLPLSYLSQLSKCVTLKLFFLLCISCQCNQGMSFSKYGLMMLWTMIKVLRTFNTWQISEANFKLLWYWTNFWLNVILQDTASQIPSKHLIFLIVIVFWCSASSNKIYKSWTYLHHSYSRGMGNARHFLNQQSLQPQTEESQACWPISPAEDVCPQPHLQVGCQDFFPGMALECPYGSPLDIEASLFVPCC